MSKQFCITDISIKHQSFVYTQLNYLTVLFLTIQFSISYLFPPCQTVLFDLQVQPLRIRVGLGVMAMRRYFAFPRITGASSSDCLVSYTGHSLEMESVYSTVSAKGANKTQPKEWKKKKKKKHKKKKNTKKKTKVKLFNFNNFFCRQIKINWILTPNWSNFIYL